MGVDAGIITLVGSDGFGRFIEQKLREEHVNLEGLKFYEGANTSSSVVLSNRDGERSFLHYLGTNGILSEEHIDLGIIRQCDLLFIAGSLLMPAFDGEPTARILKTAKELGKLTVMDTAWDSTGRWMDVIKCCIPYIDFFMPSIEEARMISGKENEREIADGFLKMGAKAVVIKLGSKGCYVRDKENDFYVDAFKVRAVDTNGAGDAFVAGFITGLVNGWPLKQCAVFANATGAKCVMKLGASDGIKSKDDVLSLIGSKYADLAD